jgi:hypothetical protein
VTNGTGVYKNSVYDSSDIDKNLSDVAENVAAETDNSIHRFTGGNGKRLAKYVCQIRGLYSYVPAACYRQYLKRPLGHSAMQFKHQLMIC